MKRFLMMGLFLLLSGCAPASLGEYRTEGEDHIKKLMHELSQVESLSGLEARQLKLKKRFTAIVDLIIAAKKFQAKHPEENTEITVWQVEMSDALKRELIRVYAIEGCAELMEEIERDALHKLDLNLRGVNL